MTKRVKQADGTYCYTENCGIHDRSYVDSTNSRAVESDARHVILDKTLSNVKSELDKLGYKNTSKHAETIVNKLFNGDAYAPSDVGGAIALAVREDNNEDVDVSKIMDSAYAIQNQLILDSTINQGDEVIISSTGERGHVTEGTNLFGNRVRVQPYTPHSAIGVGELEWHRGAEVVKVIPTYDGLTRQYISTAPRDALIPAQKIGDLIDEETSADTRNPQALNGLSNEDALTVREELMEIATRARNGFPEHRTKTKAQVVDFLKYEQDKKYEWLEEKDRKNVKKALGNLINYIQPSTKN